MNQRNNLHIRLNDEEKKKRQKHCRSKSTAAQGISTIYNTTLANCIIFNLTCLDAFSYHESNW